MGNASSSPPPLLDAPPWVGPKRLEIIEAVRHEVEANGLAATARAFGLQSGTVARMILEGRAHDGSFSKIYVVLERRRAALDAIARDDAR